MTVKEYKAKLIEIFHNMEDEHGVNDVHIYRDGYTVCDIKIH